MPGDRLLPVRVEDRGSFLRVLSHRLVEPSPLRISPSCPLFSQCGGCDWMQMERQAQVEAKGKLVAEAFSRTGGFSLDTVPMVAGEGEWGFRGRVRLHIDPLGRVGFFARGSHQVVEVVRCPVSHPRLQPAWDALQEEKHADFRALACFSGVELRHAPGGAEVLIHLFPRQGANALSGKGREVAERLAERFAVAVAGSPVRPFVEQRWPLRGGVEMRAPPLAFTQVNWPVNLLLVEAVVAGAAARGVKTFCDLYCGAGNFALSLGKQGLVGAGVESQGEAIAAARRSGQGMEGLEFLAGDVGRKVDSLVAAGRHFDLVILDPPRTGAQDALSLVTRLSPLFIAYCACDPVTQARDLRILTKGGYHLEAVQGFDMFPQTHHVETLAWMRRDAKDFPNSGFPGV